MTSFAFGLVALFTVAAALAVVFSKKTFQSAVWLMIFMVAIAALFLLMGSELVAVLQVIVYAGAIVVLFLFVIQLLNLDPQETPLKIFNARRNWAILAGIVFSMTVGIAALIQRAPTHTEALKMDMAAIRELCTLFLSKYLIVFELTSVLLLAAIIGAMLLAKREYLN
jgi:NADH-quinone oxidoreductase subunit J